MAGRLSETHLWKEKELNKSQNSGRLVLKQSLSPEAWAFFFVFNEDMYTNVS